MCYESSTPRYGRPGIVLRHFCDNLQLEPTSQVRRIKRTEAIADDLVYTRVQTDGGPQIMSTVVLHAAPFWLTGIDPKRVREEIPTRHIFAISEKSLMSW